MDDDAAVVESTDPVTTSEAGDSEGTVGTGLNPSWEPVLALADPRTHDAMKEHLKSWDDNYRKLESEYNEFKKTATTPTGPSPFDEFQGIDPAEIRAALQVTQTISQDPRRVTELLAQELGLTLAEAKAVEAEAKKQQSAEFDFSEDDDPRLKQMYEMMQADRERLSKFEQAQQERYQQELAHQQQLEEQRLQQQYDAQVNQEFKDLTTAHPEILNASPQLMEMLWMKAAHLAGQGDKTPLQTAYTQLNSFTESIKATVAPKSTPLFVPTGGQAPPANETASQSTRDRALAMLQQIHSNGQG